MIVNKSVETTNTNQEPKQTIRQIFKLNWINFNHNLKGKFRVLSLYNEFLNLEEKFLIIFIDLIIPDINQV